MVAISHFHAHIFVGLTVRIIALSMALGGVASAVYGQDLLPGPRFTGESPPVSGSDGTLSFDTNPSVDTRFRWQSSDSILGDIDTGVVEALLWRYIAGSPARLVFRGTGNGAAINGNVLFEPYDRGVIDVVAGGRRVRYLVTRARTVPLLKDLRTEFSETFFSADPLLDPATTDNFFHAFVDWGIVEPGQVSFDINGGNEKVDAGDNDPYEATYQIETDLAPSGITEIGAVATSTDGTSSERVAIELGTARIPEWMRLMLTTVGEKLKVIPVTTEVYDNEIQYDSNGRWPDPPFEYELRVKIPDWVPLLDGIDLGFAFKVNETFLDVDKLQVSSKGSGVVRAQGQSGIETELVVIDIAIPEIKYGIDGKLKLEPGMLSIEEMTYTGRGQTKVGKAFSVVKIPGVKGALQKLVARAKLIPGVGRLLRRFVLVLRRSKLKLEGEHSLGLSTKLKEEAPGFLDTHITFDSGSVSYGQAGKASLILEIFKGKLEGSLGMKIGSDQTLTVDANGRTFSDIFGHEAMLKFISDLSLTIQEIKAEWH